MKKGFTLIEIIIVLAFVSIISTVGIAGYVQYSRIQKLNSSALDFVTVLQTAKSRALSQVKDDSLACGSNSLDGYAVSITTNNIYLLQVQCGGSTNRTTTSTKNLSSNITFADTNVGNVFLFNVLNGIVTGASDTGSDVIISSSENNTSKRVRVYSNGRIIVP